MKDMEPDVMNEPLLKERSYVKSISAGVRLPLRHPWGFLRQLWPLLLFTVLLWGVLSKWVAADLWIFYQQATAIVAFPSALVDVPFFKVAAWGLLAMLLLGMWAGQTAFLMSRYKELTYLPAVKPWLIWRDIYPFVLRGILLCVVGYVVTVGWAVLSLCVMPGRLWAAFLFIVLTVVWALIYVPVGQHYMMEKRSFLSALIWPFKNLRRLGGTSAIVVVCGIMVLLVIVGGCIPAICTTYVAGLSDVSVMMGDGTDLPSSFGFLRSVSYALAFLISPITWTFIFVPLCFQWGSDEAVLMESKEDSNQER